MTKISASSSWTCNRCKSVARPELDLRAFRWPCKNFTTELPSHPVISTTTFNLKSPWLQM